VRKNLNGTTFSAEAGNLYNKHSYKYSGEQRAWLRVRSAALLQVLLPSAAGNGAAAQGMQTYIRLNSSG
jgi:hypothetical protein